VRDSCFRGFVYKHGRRGSRESAVVGVAHIMAGASKNSLWVVSSVFRKNLFSGKAAIVTGGGTGIGRAITQELLYLGCWLLITCVLREVTEFTEAASVYGPDGISKQGSPSISRCHFRAELKTHLYTLAFHWLFVWELLKRLNWTELNWTIARFGLRLVNCCFVL